MAEQRKYPTISRERREAAARICEAWRSKRAAPDTDNADAWAAVIAFVNAENAPQLRGAIATKTRGLLGR